MRKQPRAPRVTGLLCLRALATLPWRASLAGVGLLTGCSASVRCPSDISPSVRGPVGDDTLTELSGIAAGNRWWWSHTDGDGEIIALDDEGVLAGTVSLQSVDAIDLEDIAVRRLDGDRIWLGDIGDNDAERDAIHAYGFLEPDALTEGLTVDVQAMAWTYPDGPRDAEALLFDPATHEAVIVTRARSGTTEAFTGSITGISQELTQLSGLVLSDLNDDVTAGDVSPDGAWVALRSSDLAWIWEVLDDDSLATTWSRVPDCEIELIPEPQGEGLGFDDDGFMTVSEGDGLPLYHYPWPP